MVVRDVGADVLGVLEAESRPLLELFSEAALAEVGYSPYDQTLLIDGNDDRGIDVGLMCRDGHGVTYIRTHIFDEDAEGRIFSRDCAEYHLVVPNGQRLVVLVNHLKSKGYGSPGDPVGAVRRGRQAARVAEIYEGLRAEGIEHIAVVGDLNDWSGGGSLDALLEDTDLKDISEHPDFEWNGRLGTWGSGNEKDKIDYVLLSPALFALAAAAASSAWASTAGRAPTTPGRCTTRSRATSTRPRTTRPSMPTSSGPSGLPLRLLLGWSSSRS